MQMCDFNKGEVTLLHGCSPVNCLNICRTPFLKNSSGCLLRVYESEYSICLTAYVKLFSVKIVKPEQGINYVQS